MHKKSFIEEQFPVSRISKESFKERKAGSGQTLTGLGKWWGRKPLILVRSVLLGTLMPSSSNPKKDLDIFLKILTMDKEGLWKRKDKPIPAARIQDLLKDQWDKYKNASSLEKKEIERTLFSKLSYDEQIALCHRPEQIEGPTPETWAEINKHLGTTAQNLPQLIQQLGQARWGHSPRVGDAFCGGGSIPFEAARLGAQTFGTDLNPVAALLTWSSIHLLGASDEEKKEVNILLEQAFERVDQKIIALGIEHDEKNARADAFLYCAEIRCPSTGDLVPLAPSWHISEKERICAVLKRNAKLNRYDIKIVTNADDETWEKASQGTVKEGYMICPTTRERFSLRELRGDNRVNGKTQYGLRLWGNEDIFPRPDDLFQERLYCIRWCDQSSGHRFYRAPTVEDLGKEQQIQQLVKENLKKWQKKGWIPKVNFDLSGEETGRLVRERGYTHWHHLFTPRQLLYLASLMEEVNNLKNGKARVAGLLGVGSSANWNSRLSHWNKVVHAVQHTFYNQALNTLFAFATRGLTLLQRPFLTNFDQSISISSENALIMTSDARDINQPCDIWITDPPYADAVHYEELSGFFLGWYRAQLPELFPDWYADAKQALAVRGAGDDFKQSMVTIYQNLCRLMPDDGIQVVMFTHQDAGVWADLGMILARAGLEVSNAWTIATETSSVGIKQGNHVQGTVLLVLRKRLADRSGFLDDIYPELENEVLYQLDLMQTVDDLDEPNFSDTDYYLAAYSAGLRVGTRYTHIEGSDVTEALYVDQAKGHTPVLELLINYARDFASQKLIPTEIDEALWRTLSNQEKFYFKGLDLESHGEARSGAYQELARGFGIKDYNGYYAGKKANNVRFKTPSEFGRTTLNENGFGASLTRHILFAIRETEHADDPKVGWSWLKNVRKDYWGERKTIIRILTYLQRFGHISHMEHWISAVKSAERLCNVISNDLGKT